MRSFFGEDFRTCADVQSVLDCVLDRSLELSATRLGNVQLMNWKSGHLAIAAQRGFEAEFLNFFRRVELGHGSACARALRTRSTIVVDDVMADPEFRPCGDIVHRAGVRAVLSIPLVSSSGALVGMLSNHFSIVRRPTDLQLRGLTELAELAANAIVRVWANDGHRLMQSSLNLLEQSYRAIEKADKLLASARHTRIDKDRLAAE